MVFYSRETVRAFFPIFTPNRHNNPTYATTNDDVQNPNFKLAGDRRNPKAVYHNRKIADTTVLFVHKKIFQQSITVLLFIMLFQSTYLLAILSVLAVAKVEGADYGLDCSFPIHSTDFQCGDLLGDRQSVYEEYMRGCREHWGEKGAKRCDSSEKDRLAMSRRQPQSMVVSTGKSGSDGTEARQQ
jgi:hypothetical protein